MAHYAFLDDNNIVTEVITGRNESEIVNGISDWEDYYGKIRNQRCVRTSYSGTIRGSFAGIGYSYNEELDVFVAPQPYASWKLDSKNQWQAPKPYPTDKKAYSWNEETLNWDLLA
jgi:hypothetical protein